MPRRPPRRAPAPARALRFALPCAMLLAGCATLGGANYVSLDQEWELGRQLETEINQQVRLVDDATLQSYVNDVGQRMVRQTTMAGRPWRFRVVRDARINAFNVPGGLVYVHTGLLAQAGSAAEFAGALAHEIGHGVARHGTRRLSQQQEASAVAGVLLGRNPGALATVATQVVAAGAFARFSRADEREADALAVPLLAATGYDPEGLARLLERLMAEGGASAGFFSTHPNPAERVQNVRAAARSISRSGLRMDDGRYASIRTRAARLQ